AAKLAIAAFIVPYIFVLSPELLMIDATVLNLLYSTFTAVVGMWGVSISMIGFCQNVLNFPQRVVFLIGGVCMIIPEIMTDAVGIALLVAAFLWQRTNKVKGAITQNSSDDL
ncbi:MAG: TRAP transporter permease, partial [Phascolarctobacterium sp.]|nr:TRAP transporter permease [Phascolarctobacterium sp.]